MPVAKHTPSTVRERFGRAVELTKLPISQFRTELYEYAKTLKRASDVPTYDTMYRYVRKGARTEPPPSLLALVAECYGFSADWLLTGEGPEKRTARDSLITREAVDRALERPDENFISSQSFNVVGTDSFSGHRREAVLRFAGKLFAVRQSQDRWMAEEDRHRLLRAAGAFLRAVDTGFSEAARESWEEYPGHGLPVSADDLLVVRSASDGWYVTWSDAVLDLFARRVIGLGERDPKNAWDLHAPTGPRMSITETDLDDAQYRTLLEEQSARLKKRGTQAIKETRSRAPRKKR
jgi:hypothetical protein